MTGNYGGNLNDWGRQQQYMTDQKHNKPNFENYRESFSYFDTPQKNNDQLNPTGTKL